LRVPFGKIDKPPPVNPSHRQTKTSPDQLEFRYA
jgi:hypothetical protein